MNEPQHIYSVEFDGAYVQRPCYVAHVDSVFGDIRITNDIRRAMTYDLNRACVTVDLLIMQGKLNPHVVINGHVRNRLLGVADMRGIPL